MTVCCHSVHPYVCLLLKFFLKWHLLLKDMNRKKTHLCLGLSISIKNLNILMLSIYLTDDLIFSSIQWVILPTGTENAKKIFLSTSSVLNLDGHLLACLLFCGLSVCYLVMVKSTWCLNLKTRKCVKDAGKCDFVWLNTLFTLKPRHRGYKYLDGIN